MRMIIVNEEAVLELMAKKGFNKIGLANEIELSQSYVNQVLNAKRNVSAPVAKKICDILGCKFEDIFYYKIPEIK